MNQLIANNVKQTHVTYYMCTNHDNGKTNKHLEVSYLRDK